MISNLSVSVSLFPMWIFMAALVCNGYASVGVTKNSIMQLGF